MSRVGSAPIKIPAGVTIEETNRLILVSGPKGKLEFGLPEPIKVQLKDDVLLVTRRDDQKQSRSLHGLTRNIINNLVIGVTNGWSKKLELVGVGFRVAGGGQKITLSIGYSHPVEIEAPEGIEFEVSDNTKIKVSGISKELVGQVAADIRKVREPDAYKGKGIRYEGEVVRKKAGKAGKAGATGAK